MRGAARRATPALSPMLWGSLPLAAILAAAAAPPRAAPVTSAPAPAGAAPTAPARAAAGAGDTGVPPDPSQARAEALVAEALKTPTAYERLRPLTDTIGARLAGSANEPRAVAWAKAELVKDGLSARLEPVMVPVWVRGKEHAEILEPGPM